MDNLIHFLKELQSDKKFKDFNEASIKQAVVLKVLSLLGWDPFNLNEIQPEYNVKEQKVDFALKQNESPEVFIVVKKDLNDFKDHIEMLLDYATQCNVKIAIYTNGISWWFFLPFAEGNTDDKRFWAIDTGEEKVELIAKRFHDFLLKENVFSGNAARMAEEICYKRKETMLINENLPKAWKKIMNEPERYLVGVITEVTKELSGYKPDREKVIEFVKAGGRVRSGKHAVAEKSEPSKRNNEKIREKYKGVSVKSFDFNGNKFDVKSWQELPWKLCNTILENHRESFENVLYITLRGRDFFSKNQYQFLMGKEIPHTGIYINTDLSEVVAVALCHEILKLFGYEESDLVIDTN